MIFSSDVSSTHASKIDHYFHIVDAIIDVISKFPKLTGTKIISGIGQNHLDYDFKDEYENHAKFRQ